jgi:hypothetical protein
VEEAGVPAEPPTMGKQLVNFITCGCESSAPFFGKTPETHSMISNHVNLEVSRLNHLVILISLTLEKNTI